MFDINLLESTITILFIKFPLSDFFIFLGAAFGFFKNYRCNMEVYKSQIDMINMSEEEKKESLKIARYKFIRDNAKTHYMKVRKIAQSTETKVDDKLLAYMENFYVAMKLTFGTPPTPSELKQMEDKANEIHEEIKLLEVVEEPTPEKDSEAVE
jgi:hypothetical protein